MKEEFSNRTHRKGCGPLISGVISSPVGVLRRLLGALLPGSGGIGAGGKRTRMHRSVEEDMATIDGVIKSMV